MRRLLAYSLVFILAFILFPAARADTDDQVLPGHLEALREAGRETENLLAADIDRTGDTPEAAVILMRAGDTAQLTVLEKGKDGSWQIAAQNDTIPASLITSASVLLLDEENIMITGTDHIRLDMMKYVPAQTPKEQTYHQAYRSLDFRRTSGGSWVLDGACDVPFEDAEEGRCPYHLLNRTDDGWVYRFYEEIIDETGWPADRSDVILEKTVPAEDMATYAELSSFDYPAFLAYLHTLAPAEYEHAPYFSAYASPSPEPAKASEEDLSACDDAAVPETVRDEAHRCFKAGPVYEGCTWIIVADEDAPDPWDEGRWYIIDVQGNRLTDESVKVINRYFSEGLVTVWKGDRAGCIDTEGNEAIPFVYDDIEDFHHGVAIARMDGKCGLISRNNEVILAFEWDGIEEAVLPEDAPEPLYRVERAGKYGFVDMNGAEKVPCVLDFTDYFLPGVSWPLLVQSEQGFGYVDQTGDLAVPCTWPNARGFEEGLARVYTGETFAYIDASGNLLFTVPEEWRVIGRFHGGLALTMDPRSRFGWIDASGALAIPFRDWENAEDFSEERAAVTRNGKIGYIDQKGNEVIPCEWDGAMPFFRGYAPVMKDGEWFVIDKEGNVTARVGRVSLYRSISLYRMTDATGRYGMMRPDGTIVTDIQWDYILESTDGVIVVALYRGPDIKCGCLSADGGTIVPCVYDDAQYSDGYFTLTRDGYLTILDRDGNTMF